LATTSVSTSRVDLSWSASTDNVGVAGYEVYRDGVPIGSTTTAAYIDSTVSSSAQYTYVVSAYDTSNNYSSMFGSVSVTTPNSDTSAPTSDPETGTSGSSDLAITDYGEESYATGNPVPATASSNTMCGNSVTADTPNLFEIRTTKNTATLYFAPPVMPYSNFYIAYSQKSDIWQYGVQYDQNSSGGALKYTINKLNSNTKYYFKIRAGNGCATGNWGNTMSATTTSSTVQRTYYKSFLTSVINRVDSFINTFLPSKSKNPSQNVTIPTPTPTPKPTIPTQTQSAPKAKFCILWWCF
jgi:chitodextrinase